MDGADMLAEVLITALLTKKRIWFLLFFLGVVGFGTYLYLNQK